MEKRMKITKTNMVKPYSYLNDVSFYSDGNEIKKTIRETILAKALSDARAYYYKTKDIKDSGVIFEASELRKVLENSPYAVSEVLMPPLWGSGVEGATRSKPLLAVFNHAFASPGPIKNNTLFWKLLESLDQFSGTRDRTKVFNHIFTMHDRNPNLIPFWDLTLYVRVYDKKTKTFQMYPHYNPLAGAGRSFMLSLCYQIASILSNANDTNWYSDDKYYYKRLQFVYDNLDPFYKKPIKQRSDLFGMPIPEVLQRFTTCYLLSSAIGSDNGSLVWVKEKVELSDVKSLDFFDFSFDFSFNKFSISKEDFNLLLSNFQPEFNRMFGKSDWTDKSLKWLFYLSICGDSNNSFDKVFMGFNYHITYNTITFDKIEGSKMLLGKYTDTQNIVSSSDYNNSAYIARIDDSKGDGLIICDGKLNSDKKALVYSYLNKQYPVVYPQATSIRIVERSKHYDSLPFFPNEMKVLANTIEDSWTIRECLELISVDLQHESSDLVHNLEQNAVYVLDEKISELNSKSISKFSDIFMTSNVYESVTGLQLSIKSKTTFSDSIKGCYTRSKLDSYNEHVSFLDDSFNDFVDEFSKVNGTNFNSAEGKPQDLLEASSSRKSLLKTFMNNLKEFATFSGIMMKSDANVDFSDSIITYKMWLSQFKDSFIKWNEEQFLDMVGTVNIDRSNYEKFLNLLEKANFASDIKIPFPSGELIGKVFTGVVSGVAKGFYNTIAIVENIYNIFDSVYSNYVVNKEFNDFMVYRGGSLVSNQKYSLMAYSPEMKPVKFISESGVDYYNRSEFMIDLGLESESMNYMSVMVPVNDAIINSYMTSNLKAKDKYLSMISGLDSPVPHGYVMSPVDELISTGVITAQAAAAGIAAAASTSGFIARLVAASVASASVLAINLAKKIQIWAELAKKKAAQSAIAPRNDGLMEHSQYSRIFLFDPRAIYGMPGSNLELAQRIVKDALAITGGFAGAVGLGALTGKVTSSISNFAIRKQVRKELIQSKTLFDSGNGERVEFKELSRAKKKAAMRWAMFNRNPGSIVNSVGSVSSSMKKELLSSMEELNNSDLKFSRKIFDKLSDETDTDTKDIRNDIKMLSELSTEKFDELIGKLDSFKDDSDKKLIALLAEVSAVLAAVGGLATQSADLKKLILRLINRVGG